MGFVNWVKNFGIVLLAFILGFILILGGIAVYMENAILGAVVLLLGLLLMLYGYYRREEWSKKRRRNPSNL